jgi:hypothetical protein
MVMALSNRNLPHISSLSYAQIKSASPPCTFRRASSGFIRLASAMVFSFWFVLILPEKAVLLKKRLAEKLNGASEQEVTPGSGYGQ